MATPAQFVKLSERQLVVLEAALDPPKVLLKRLWPAGDVFDPQAPTKVLAVSYIQTVITFELRNLCSIPSFILILASSAFFLSVGGVEQGVIERGGGRPEISPPPRILAKMMLAVKNHARMHLRTAISQTFPGGACPQTPLLGACYTRHLFPPPPQHKFIYETL